MILMMLIGIMVVMLMMICMILWEDDDGDVHENNDSRDDDDDDHDDANDDTMMIMHNDVGHDDDNDDDDIDDDAHGDDSAYLFFPIMCHALCSECRIEAACPWNTARTRGRKGDTTIRLCADRTVGAIQIAVILYPRVRLIEQYAILTVERWWCAPLHTRAVVATFPLLVAYGAERRLLAGHPALVRIPVPGVTEVAKATSHTTAIHARAIERLCITFSHVPLWMRHTCWCLDITIVWIPLPSWYRNHRQEQMMESEIPWVVRSRRLRHS